MLRELGMHPASPAAFPAHNTTKALAYRAVRKLKGLRKSA